MAVPLSNTTTRVSFTHSFLSEANLHEDDHSMEKKIARLQEYTPLQQLALMYNDADAYLLGKMTPMEAWYAPREKMIRTYAALDWDALGHVLRPVLRAHCRRIRLLLDQMSQEMEKGQPFSLAIFCSVLTKIDYLWHIILPSDIRYVTEPKAMEVLTYFRVI